MQGGLRLTYDPKLTQRTLAGKLKQSYYMFISQVETGTARVPSENLLDWAKVLDADPKEFAKKPLSL